MSPKQALASIENCYEIDLVPNEDSGYCKGRNQCP